MAKKSENGFLVQTRIPSALAPKLRAWAKEEMLSIAALQRRMIVHALKERDKSQAK